MRGVDDICYNFQVFGLYMCILAKTRSKVVPYNYAYMTHKRRGYRDRMMVL